MHESKSAALATAPGFSAKAALHRHAHKLNVAVSWTNSILAAVGSLLVLPATLGALGVREYGTWLFVLSFVTQLRLLDLGMSSGCMKFTAGCIASGDRAGLARTFHTSAALFGSAGVVSLLCTALLMFALPAAYPVVLGDMTGVIGVLGLSLSLDFFFRPYAASLRARSLFFVYDGVEIVTYSIFKLALVLYLARVGLSVWLLCLLTVAETAVRNGTVFFLSLRFCRWTSLPDWQQVDRAIFRKLLGFSGACFVIGIAEVFRIQFQNGAIGHFIADPRKAMAVYNIGLRLVWLASTSIGVIWAVMIPRFSGLVETGDQAGTRKLLRSSSVTTGLLSGFALVSIGVFGQAFLRLWIKQPWVDESFVVSLIALPGYFASMLQGPVNGLLTGAGRMKWQTGLTLAETAVVVVLSMLLATPWGIYGVCVAMTAPSILFRGIGLTWVLKKEFGIPMLETFRMHGPTVMVSLTYLAASIVFAFFTYDTLLQFFAACLAATAIFGAIVLIWIPPARAKAVRLWRSIVTA
jgi:O-antigen/teichoic acid export membrane protein